jgi:allantoicase
MPSMFTDLPDLAAERLGGAVIAANDEFFAPKEALIKPGAPEWRKGEYTERGKWMDGWETRRRRTPGHDWAIIRLGVPGIVRGVVIDTSFFTGNYPEFASIDACALEGPGGPSTQTSLTSLTSLTSPSSPSSPSWKPLLPKSPLKGNTTNPFEIGAKLARRVTHLRLNIYPDGGVARLRVHGEAVPDAGIFREGREVDLAALENGGLVVSASDMHYGNPQNLLLPGRSAYMGDGWETRRRRGPGHDWTIVRLARRGVIERVELDTDHFKGNAPGWAMLEYTDAGPKFDAGKARWQVLVPRKPLEPHTRHRWDVLKARAATHVRLNIYPDGGIARLRLFGRAEP